MDYEFRTALMAEVSNYSYDTPLADETTVDCSLGVNPYGFHPAVAQALRSHDYQSLGRYPHEDVLRPALIRYWEDYASLKTDQITLCNGGYLGLIAMNNLFSGNERNRVVSFVPAFTDMLTNVEFYEMELVPVPFARHTQHDCLNDLLNAIDSRTALVYLDQPQKGGFFSRVFR